MERKGKAGEKRKTVLSPETESLLEEFLLYFGTRRNASPASQMAYGTDLRNFASFMKRRGTDLGSPERVTARDVQAWVAWLYPPEVGVFQHKYVLPFGFLLLIACGRILQAARRR